MATVRNASRFHMRSYYYLGCFGLLSEKNNTQQKEVKLLLSPTMNKKHQLLVTDELG